MHRPALGLAARAEAPPAAAPAPSPAGCPQHPPARSRAGGAAPGCRWQRCARTRRARCTAAHRTPRVRPVSGAFHIAHTIAGPCLQHDAGRGRRSLELRWSCVEESLNASASPERFVSTGVGTICRKSPGLIGRKARLDLCQQSRPGPLPTTLGCQPTLERNPLSKRGLRTIRRLARPTLLTKGSGPFASKADRALCQQSRPGPLSAKFPRDLLQIVGASHPLERFFNDRRLRPTILQRSPLTSNDS